MELLAVLDGIILAIMLCMNGELSAKYGNYHATVMIHFAGLILIIIILWVRHYKISLKNKVPWYLYMAGPIGISTVILNNITTLKLGVTVTIALGLLGQTLTSIIFDYKGMLGTPKRSFKKEKWVGIGFIVLGIGIMMY